MSYKTQPTEPFQNFISDLNTLVKNYRDLLWIDYSITPYLTSELSPEISSDSPVAFSIKEDGLQIHAILKSKDPETAASVPETSQPVPQIPGSVMSGLTNTWSQLFQSVQKVDSTSPQEEPSTISPEPSASITKTQAEIASMSEEEYREWVMRAMEDPARREAFVKAVYATTEDDSNSDPQGAIARMDGTPEELGAALRKELLGESAVPTSSESAPNDPLSQGQFWTKKGDNLIPRVTTGTVTISGNYDIQFQEDGSIRISPRAAN